MFIPAVYFILSHLIPQLRSYSLRGRAGALLLSALIGLLAVLVTLNVPYFIWSLPKHTIEISVPSGEPGRSLTIQWFTTSLGDIGFDQIEQQGDWQRTDTGFTFSGISPSTLRWTGRTGISTQIIFTGNPSAGMVSISINGISQPLKIASPPGTPIKFETILPVHPLNQFLVIFSLWFAISFLFLILTLFLLHVPLRIGSKNRDRLEKVEASIKPASLLFFPKTGKVWWQGRDWFIITVFLLTACLFFLGRWNGLSHSWI